MASKKPGNGAARDTTPARSGSSDWNGSLGELRTLIEHGNFDDHPDQSRVSIVMQNRSRSMRPSDAPTSTSKFVGIMVGIGLGLAVVAEVVIRLVPRLLGTD